MTTDQEILEELKKLNHNLEKIVPAKTCTCEPPATWHSIVPWKCGCGTTKAGTTLNLLEPLLK